MAQPQDLTVVGNAFVRHYYQLFDTQRNVLASLYRDSSKLTFEKDIFVGQAAIMGKLSSLTFQQVQHAIKSVDCQPSGCNGILVLVTGELKVDDSPNPIKFSQLFHLLPGDNNSFWVHNDMFRLNYG